VFQSNPNQIFQLPNSEFCSYFKFLLSGLPTSDGRSRTDRQSEFFYLTTSIHEIRAHFIIWKTENLVRVALKLLLEHRLKLWTRAGG
jgi:hypothetical protein